MRIDDMALRLGAITIALSAGLLIGNRRGQATRPTASSYDDCILEHVKPGLSTPALAAVRRACRSKFPDARPDPWADFEEVPPPPAGYTLVEPPISRQEKAPVREDSR